MIKLNKPKFTLFQASQEKNEDYIKGRTVLTINWERPTKFELIEEELINSFSGLDTNFQLDIGDIESVKLFANEIEIDSIHYIIDINTGSGIVYSTAANIGDNITIEYVPIDPINIANPILGESLIGSCVPNRDNEFQISNNNINPNNTIQFYSNSQAIIHSNPIIDTVNKVITTDKWYFNYETGKGVLRSGSAIPSTLSEITIDYFYQIKLEKYELYKIENGSNNYTSYDEVINDQNNIIVNDDISSNLVNYIEEMTSDENGTNFMYYLFAVSSDGMYSNCDLQLIETIPSIIQNFVLTIRTGEVNLYWDLVEEPNIDGYNIWRCEGTVLQKQNLIKLNNELVTTNEFSDSSLNTETRKSPTEVTYPIESKSYVYIIEAVDINSSWKVGIENESSETSENLICQLIPYEDE